MSSVALIELHQSFEGAETEPKATETETETNVEAKPKQAQPSTPTVTSPTTPPTTSSPVVKDAPIVGELKAEHDIPSTPPAGKTKGSAPAKPAEK